MDVRYTVGVNEYKHMSTEETRDAFMFDLFENGKLNLLYCEVERTIAGAAVPLDDALVLEAGRELASEYFCERRELGVFNIGGEGSVTVDGEEFSLQKLDMLYIGRGSKDIQFASVDAQNPARFYLISYPAHKDYPTTLIHQSEANRVELGSKAEANERTIFQYIHENGAQSCQLVMGFTELAEGSVWNTMPSHTHERRTELYLYFGMEPDTRVFHFMGPGNETRHLVLGTEQGAISPMWSIHSGCGTKAYTFCWAMGGENQRFDDMDFIPMKDLR